LQENSQFSSSLDFAVAAKVCSRRCGNKRASSKSKEAEKHGVRIRSKRHHNPLPERKTAEQRLLAFAQQPQKSQQRRACAGAEPENELGERSAGAK